MNLFLQVISKFGGVLLDKENSAQDYTHVICATQKSSLYQLVFHFLDIFFSKVYYYRKLKYQRCYCLHVR